MRCDVALHGRGAPRLPAPRRTGRPGADGGGGRAAAAGASSPGRPRGQPGAAVVTVGAGCAPGTPENVIPDTATITLNFRAFDPEVQRRLTEGARRIIDAEAAASGASHPPSYQTLSSFPVTVNDAGLTARLAGVLANTTEMDPVMGSEDFGLFGTAAGVPSVFWGIGGSSDDAPANHSPMFAPRIETTLPAGVHALVGAVRHVLG